MIGNEDIYQAAVKLYRRDLRNINLSPAEKIANDTLDPSRSEEQLQIVRRYAGEIKGKKFLEVGCGLGTLVVTARKDGIEAFGIEPGLESYEICQQVLNVCGLDCSIVKNSPGEQLPFPDNNFDVVYLNHVIEHVKNVDQVLRESIRVARVGGHIVCVAPNYGSFFEGHYGLLWIPYLSKTLAKLYVSLYGRDIRYVNELNFVTMKSLRKMLKNISNVSVLSWGIDLWQERMDTLKFSDWAELGRLKKVLQIVQKLGLIPITKFVCRLIEAYNPLVITLKKL